MNAPGAASSMRVLVTGGAGFIGSWVIKKLVAAGIVPVVFDRTSDRRVLQQIAGTELAETILWRTDDISDTESVINASVECDTIIHLASLLTPACRADPILGANVNLIGLLNVFLAARKHGMSRVLYISSAGVFGPGGGSTPEPTTLYGAFKLAGEHSARAFFEDDGISSIGFRPYVVYGPGREIGLSAGPTLACRAAARGEPYTIPFTGTIDMIHVEDVADALVKALSFQKPGAKVVNLLGTQTTTEEIIATIQATVPEAEIDAAGPPMPITLPELATPSLFSDWKPRSLEQGISETIAYYRYTAGKS